MLSRPKTSLRFRASHDPRGSPVPDPQSSGRRARDRSVGHQRGNAFQGGPRGRFAGSLHARPGARGLLRGTDVRRAGGADPQRGSGRRLRPRPRPERRLERPLTLELLKDLMDALPEDLARQVFTHASWTERRSDSYSRLAFLGDSVLSLAVTSHLYPRLEAERYRSEEHTSELQSRSD